MSACFGKVDRTCLLARQLSVHQLDVTIKIGMLQRLGERNIPAQNAVGENLWMKNLRGVREENGWKVERDIQGRYPKDVPIRPDSQGKFGGKANGIELGMVI